MNMTTGTVRVGEPVVIPSRGPTGSFEVVFEDEGDTGYFYALDPSLPAPILDALHVYNVAQVTDAASPLDLQIIWSADGNRAVLLLNRWPHAAFDFALRRGYCRTNFPPSSWSFSGHAWDDAVLAGLWPAA